MVAEKDEELRREYSENDKKKAKDEKLLIGYSTGAFDMLVCIPLGSQQLRTTHELFTFMRAWGLCMRVVEGQRSGKIVDGMILSTLE